VKDGVSNECKCCDCSFKPIGLANLWQAIAARILEVAWTVIISYDWL
jgi:hypothetical protein